MKNFYIFTLISSLFVGQLIAQPTITDFSPTNGPVGISVVITGTNFDAVTPTNNIVFFGTTQATVTAATTTTLTVTVPSGATYMPITVLVNGLIAYSASPFLVSFGGNGINSGSFDPSFSNATGTSPISIAIDDIDGDGKPDLVVANFGANSISIFRNNSTVQGSISYDTKIDYAVGINPYAVALGDFDGDGKKDIAVVRYGDNNVSIFRNTSTVGSISHESQVNFATGNGPVAAAIKDIDGDGKPDLAVINITDATVSVFRNASSGIGVLSFFTKQDFTTGADPIDVAIDDLDGDGKVDLAVVNQSANTITTYLNTSTSGSISYGTQTNFSTGSVPYLFSTGDLDGDGKSDIAITNYGANTVSVLRNISSIGTINYATKVDFATGSLPQAVAIGDIDGDGKPDLAVASRSSNAISVYRNTSTSGTIDANSFASKTDYVSGSEPVDIAIVDFDNDGKPDMVSANIVSANISFFRNAAITPILALPYLTTNGGDFETNQGEWKAFNASGTPFELGNSSITGKDGTSSSSFAWVTGLNDATYLDNSTSELISPNFDFSGTNNYELRFKAKFKTENGWDGFNVRYSVDGGATWSVLNNSVENGWYTTVSSNNDFGSSIFSGDFQSQFQSYQTDISFLDSNPNVSFKFTFLSDGTNVDIGAAIDDFEIGEASASTETDFTAFSFAEQASPATIDIVNHTIAIQVISGTSLANLIASFTLSSGATAAITPDPQVSGTSQVNFTAPITYTITAEDGTTTQDWIVTVTVANDIYAAYSFTGNFLDETGAHNGTELTANNSFVNDRLGFSNNAFQFDYTNTPTIELQNTASANFGDEITVTAWIRPEAYNVDDVQLLSNEIEGVGFNLFLATNDLNATELLTERRLYAGITGVSFGPFGKVLLDRWTHVAFKFQRGVGTTIFINGVNQGTYGFITGTEDIPIPISTSVINIGKDYDGVMDEIKIFNNALTDQEIYDEFNLNRWPFNSLDFRGPEGGTATDWGLDLSNNGFKYVRALSIIDPGTYQFRATATTFEVFMGDSELDGVAEPGANQINVTAGLYAVDFNITNFEYGIIPITTVGIIGSALTGDNTGWNSDIDLTDLGNGQYEINNLTLLDGEWKIRVNDDWNINWGSNNNDGTLNPDGVNIPITAGVYSFTIDVVNQTYTVVAATPLVAHYTFDGGVITDITGNGYNGTTPTSTLFSMDRVGQYNGAIEPQGDGIFATINHAGAWDMQGIVMLNAWIRPNALPLASEFGHIIFTEDVFGELDINSEGILFYHWSGGTVGTNINAIKVNQWSMITLVIDANNELQLYVNGEVQYLKLEGTTTEGESIPITRHTGIGTNAYLGYNTTNRLYNGSIDDVRVYLNGLLTPTEIKDLYEAELSGGLDQKVASYPFDFGSILDVSGNSYHGDFRDVNFNVATVVTTTDRFGNPNGALQFNNDGNSNTIFHERSINLRNNFTVNMWVNPTSIADSGVGELGDVLISDNANGRLMIFNDASLAYHYPANNATSFPSIPSASNIVSLNQWQMVTYSIDNSDNLTISLNGTVVASGNVSDHDFNLTDRFILAQPDNAGGTDLRYYHGAMDDVDIYQRTLTTEEISALYTNQSMVVHYTFDGNALDQSGNGNNGTTNGATLTTDRHGNANGAYAFNGTSSDLITINNGTGVTLDNDVTYSMWIYPVEEKVSRIIWDNSSEFGDLIINLDNTLRYHYSDGTNQTEINSTAQVTQNAWNMISFTREGSTISFYINGVFDKSETAHDPSVATIITNINKGDSDGSAFFNGSTDEVRIYNKALTASDIFNIYDSERVIGTQANITDFSFSEQTATATIGANTVDIEVAYNTDLTGLIPTFTLSNGAIASINGTEQVSGTTSNDFTNAVTYTVAAEDGVTTIDYTVTVTVAPNTETEITAFSFSEQLDAATINTGTISIAVANATDVTTLVASFTASAGATVAVNGVEQVSGTTANDFTNMVTYTVTAEDGITTQSWDVTVNVQTVNFALTSLPSSIDASVGTAITIDVQDNSAFSTITFLYRGISSGPAANFITGNTTSNGTVHSFTLSGNEDPLAVEFKFKGDLVSGGSVETGTQFININHTGDGLTIPSDRIKFSETDATAYRAISIPLNLNSASSTTVFDELGAYNENWRLYSFTPSAANGGSFNEHTSGTTMNLGKGFFILAKNSASIKTGAGSTPKVTPTEPVEIQIKTGWNLIGNPYNFSIDWSEVLAANTDVANIDQLNTNLKVWLGSYANSQNYLLSFQAGFVLSAADMTIKIPLIKNTSLPTNGGRIVEKEETDLPSWVVTLNLNDKNKIVSQSKVGMHTNANILYDKYDLATLPSLTTNASLKVEHPEFFIPSFTSDFVPITNYYEWEVTMGDFKEGAMYSLDWKLIENEQSSKTRVLYDISNQKRIDMSEVNSYSFTAKKAQKFKVFYGDVDEINNKLLPLSMALGDIYPNPARDQLVIPFNIPEINNGSNVEVSLYNLQGRKIITLVNKKHTYGFHQITWDRINEKGAKVPSGLYIVLMKTGSIIQSKKIVLN